MARLRVVIELSDDGYIASNADVHGKYLGRIHAVEKKLKFVGVPDIGFETLTNCMKDLGSRAGLSDNKVRG
jgi:hypothetical protein